MRYTVQAWDAPRRVPLVSETAHLLYEDEITVAFKRISDRAASVLRTYLRQEAR